MKQEGKGYPSDVGDDAWEFCASYLALMKEEAPQRRYGLREVFNGLGYRVRTGCMWRMIPNDLPPWQVVHQQAMRWFKAGCFEAVAHDLRVVLRMAERREQPHPGAVAIDSRTLQSTPESGGRAKYDGYKRKKGSNVHAAVGTLGHLLAFHIIPADAQDRSVVGGVAAATQEATGQNVKVAFVDQGYTGGNAAKDTQNIGIELHVVRLPKAKRGFMKRWVAERSFAWASPFRQLARDHERLASTLTGFYWLAFIILTSKVHDSL